MIARPVSAGHPLTRDDLAALLVLADGCRRAGLFEWVGALMASGARGSPRRLLMMVLVMALSPPPC